MTTFGTAVWHGGLKDGKGAISTKSGALNNYPYGFASRFEGKPGTNPEELIGAAHAGCFTMALKEFGSRFILPPCAGERCSHLPGSGSSFARMIRHLRIKMGAPGSTGF